MRTFMEIVKSVSKNVKCGRKTAKYVDENLARQLPQEERELICRTLARCKAPIVSAFITENLESWVASMGYLITKKGKYCTFRCLEEHVQLIQ
jgi:hypothetical protein